MNYNKLYEGAKEYLDTFIHEQDLNDEFTDAFVEGGKFVLYNLAEKIKMYTPDDIDPNKEINELYNLFSN